MNQKSPEYIKKNGRQRTDLDEDRFGRPIGNAQIWQENGHLYVISCAGIEIKVPAKHGEARAKREVYKH